MTRMTGNPFSVAGWRALAAAGVLFAGLCASVPAMAQQIFTSPDAAAEALGDAISRSDDNALGRVLGRQNRSLLPPSGFEQDDVYDFLGAWARHHAVKPDGERRAQIEVGQSGWTFPVPLARQQDGWAFDLRAGQQEVRRRRLGRNELITLEALQVLADAQQRYAEQVGQGRYAACCRQPGAARPGLAFLPGPSGMAKPACIPSSSAATGFSMSATWAGARQRGPGPSAGSRPTAGGAWRIAEALPAQQPADWPLQASRGSPHAALNSAAAAGFALTGAAPIPDRHRPTPVRPR
ncbi:DUF2950 family protein [Cupriavidus necator]